jgi:hypothetical protein
MERSVQLRAFAALPPVPIRYEAAVDTVRSHVRRLLYRAVNNCEGE